MPMHQGRDLPVFSMREVDLPDLKFWEVGSQHYILLKIEQTAKRKAYSDAREDRNKLEATFKVISARSVGDEPISVKDIEAREFRDLKAKALAGEL